MNEQNADSLSEILQRYGKPVPVVIEKSPSC